MDRVSKPEEDGDGDEKMGKEYSSALWICGITTHGLNQLCLKYINEKASESTRIDSLTILSKTTESYNYSVLIRKSIYERI